MTKLPSTTESVSMISSSSGSSLMSGTANEMAVSFGEGESLKFSSGSMTKLPSVSGSGSLSGGATGGDLGAYTVSGSFDGASGAGSYDFAFDWGSCSMATTPTSGVGADMMGSANLDCSGSVPSGMKAMSGFSSGSIRGAAWSESNGEGASTDKFVSAEKQVSVTFNRENGKKISGVGVMTYFPTLSGHGEDDFNGKYTIEASGETKLNGHNSASIVYDNGATTDLSYSISLGANGKFSMAGSYTDLPTGTSGGFSMNGAVNMKPIKGYCLNDGKTQPESWLWSWPKRSGCPYPSNCAATVDVCDAWVKVKKRHDKSGKLKKTKQYGFSMKIEIPEQYWSNNGWTVALRFPKGQTRGTFNVWNAQVYNVYETARETVFVFTQKWWTGGDLVDKYSFMVTADYLSTPDHPSILFWQGRITRESCYADPKMSRSRDNKDYLAEAIENSKSVRKLDDISTIKIRNGKISAVTK